MRLLNSEVAAGAIVDELAWPGELRRELFALLAGVFAQARSRLAAFAYIGALLAGHRWDWTAALAALQRFIVARLGDAGAILAIEGNRHGGGGPAVCRDHRAGGELPDRGIRRIRHRPRPRAV